MNKKKRYQKKPVVVEAALWDGAVGTITQFAPFENATRSPEVATNGDLVIYTLEGEMLARKERDYIIKGIKGEIYPCKPDIFKESYDEL